MICNLCLPKHRRANFDLDLTPMKPGRLLKRIWVLPVLVAALIAAHAGALYAVFSRMAWTLGLGLLLLVLLIHVGALGPIYATFRRWFRHRL